MYALMELVYWLAWVGMAVARFIDAITGPLQRFA